MVLTLPWCIFILRTTCSTTKYILVVVLVSLVCRVILNQWGKGMFTIDRCECIENKLYMSTVLIAQNKKARKRKIWKAFYHNGPMFHSTWQVFINPRGKSEGHRRHQSVRNYNKEMQTVKIIKKISSKTSTLYRYTHDSIPSHIYLVRFYQPCVRFLLHFLCFF